MSSTPMDRSGIVVLAAIWLFAASALIVRFALRVETIVAVVIVSLVMALIVDLSLDRGPMPRRPMVAFTILAPWLTCDVRSWWPTIGSVWDARIHTAHGFPILSADFDHASRQGLDDLFNTVKWMVGLTIIALLVWWPLGKIDWRRHVLALRTAAVVGVIASVASTALLLVHGRNLPTLEEYGARSSTAPVVATLFDFPVHQSAPAAMNDKDDLLDVGEGVSALRRCTPGCHLTLVRGSRKSCTMSLPNLHIPVLLRRDKQHNLWLFDDGVDRLAYRGSDLRCIDLSTERLLLVVKPARAWIWGGCIGLILAVCAQLAGRLLVTRAKRRGAETEERAARVLVTLEAFTVAIVFATMPPVLSTLLGVYGWSGVWTMVMK